MSQAPEAPHTILPPNTQLCSIFCSDSSASACQEITTLASQTKLPREPQRKVHCWSCTPRDESNHLDVKKMGKMGLIVVLFLDTAGQQSALTLTLLSERVNYHIWLREPVNTSLDAAVVFCVSLTVFALQYVYLHESASTDCSGKLNHAEVKLSAVQIYFIEMSNLLQHAFTFIKVRTLILSL